MLNSCGEISSKSFNEPAQIFSDIFVLSPLWYEGKERLWAQPPDCVISWSPNNRTVITTRLGTNDWDKLKVCAACQSSMKGAHHDAKESLWDGLPEMFGLPEWSDLEKMKTEALK